MVNEIGETGLEGNVLRESGNGLAKAMLSNGCFCCLIGTDRGSGSIWLITEKRRDGAGPCSNLIRDTIFQVVRKNMHWFISRQKRTGLSAVGLASWLWPRRPDANTDNG